MTQLVLDTFTAADDTLLTAHTSDTEQGWSMLLGSSPKIVGNKLRRTSGESAWFALTAEDSLSDGTLKVVVNRSGSGTYSINIQLVVRASDSNNYYAVGLFGNNPTALLAITRLEAGFPVETTIGAYGYPDDTDHLLHVVCNGSTITVTTAYEQIVLTDQTFNQSATRHGLRAFGTTLATATFDDFELLSTTTVPDAPEPVDPPPPPPPAPTLEEEDEYLMIAEDYGFHPLNDLIIIPHTTHNQDGPVSPVTDGISIAIYKGVSTVERNTPAGITLSVDHDTVTGHHLISIDTSDNTDAGFYAENQTYTVLIESTLPNATYEGDNIVRLRQVRFRLGHQQADLRKILGTLLDENSEGNLADNLSIFLDNDDALTEVVLDDIAAGAIHTTPIAPWVDAHLVDSDGSAANLRISLKQAMSEIPLAGTTIAASVVVREFQSGSEASLFTLAMDQTNLVNGGLEKTQNAPNFVANKFYVATVSVQIDGGATLVNRLPLLIGP